MNGLIILDTRSLVRCEHRTLPPVAGTYKHPMLAIGFLFGRQISSIVRTLQKKACVLMGNTRFTLIDCLLMLFLSVCRKSERERLFAFD